MNHILEIEKPLLELEEKIKELKRINITGRADLNKEIQVLEEKAEILKRNIFENLSSWDKVLMARHPQRPVTLDYIRAIFSDFFECHGDRFLRDDPAILSGLARLDGLTVVVIGHQKGKDTRENLARNFGMPNPEGLRKAARLMKLASKFSFPIIFFVDTPGAYPGIEAEEHGQYEAIAENIALIMSLPVPVIVVVIGEGGSGGALAVGCGDRVYMLENSIYSVISPEGCASILWRDASKAPQAAKALRLTADELLDLGIIDEIIPEPLGGVHRSRENVFKKLKSKLKTDLSNLMKFPVKKLLDERYLKYKKMAVFEE